ncbi:acylneuraminate cytidylyltransferase family protein, partial [Streptosporangium canum]|uniref:acylneuraminate cytidylyltransferase family protein n=1 Tax=Streptosporangium canum TaxID=324952 RepID=UPI00342C9EC5
MGVPLKNLAAVGGTPLVARAVKACVRAELIDEVVVSTDHAEIAAVAREAGATVIHRPEELSDATASSESAVLHVLDHMPDSPDVVVLVQCTSAFIDPADLDTAIVKVLDGTADVVFSGLRTHEFLWSAAGAGVNHDPSFRPRRQDREPHFRETGAF